MDVNFIKMHNPNNPAKKFAGKSHLGRYSDSVLELDDNIGRIMDVIRAEAPDTIVITTADNGAWQDAYPDAGTHPFRGEKGSAFEAGWRVPGIMWWPSHIPAGAKYDEMMSHIDCWATLASMVGVTPPPHGEWKDNNGKPIYFDSIDNSAYILGKAKHSARDSWIYIDGENFMGARADIGGDPNNDDIHIAWKYLYTAKDTWLGPTAEPGIDRLALLPDDGSVREIRHGFQRSDVVAHADVLAGPVCGRGQRLGVVADLPGDHRIRQVDREVSKHQAIPGRRVERPDSGSSAPGEPGAAGRSEQGAARERWRRLSVCRETRL